VRRFVLVFVLCASANAAAQAPLLENNGFNVDLYQGPVLGSARVIGLGGAYAALAEDAVGIQFNPASVAHRSWYSQGRWDWDLTLDWLMPNVGQSQEFRFDNSALPGSASGFAVIEAGGLLQYRNFGIGVYLDLQTFDRDITSATAGSGRSLQFDFTTAHVDLGYAFLDHQLVVGAGLRIGGVTARETRGSGSVFDLTATGAEVGALLRPAALPVRLGVAFYSALNRDKPASGAVPDLAMPWAVVLPWQVTAGIAWQLARHPLNPRPERERAVSVPPTTQPASTPALPRPDGGHYLLVSVDVQVAGAVEDAVGVSSFLAGVREDSGGSASVSIRAGAEAEVWRRRLRLRAGTYYEPSRLSDPILLTGTSGRLHGTGGFDVRLFDFSLFGPRSLRLGLVTDIARRYSNAGISVGFWH
jgi:hypothetical protein